MPFYCTNFQYWISSRYTGRVQIMRVLEISVNVTTCNVITVPPHDVIQKKMTPWVQLTAEGTWPMTGVCGVGVAIAEKSHLTLWLAMSGCQVGGCKRRKETIGYFFLFPKSWFNHPLHHLFHTLSLAPDLGYYSSLLWRQKKKPQTSQTENAVQNNL